MAATSRLRQDLIAFVGLLMTAATRQGRSLTDVSGQALTDFVGLLIAAATRQSQALTYAAGLLLPACWGRPGPICVGLLSD